MPHRGIGENPECGYLKLPLKPSGSIRFDEKPFSTVNRFVFILYSIQLRSQGFGVYPSQARMILTIR